MASVLSDSLNSGVAGVRIGENANSFKLAGIDGGFTKLNGGLSNDVMEGVGGIVKKFAIPDEIKCLGEIKLPSMPGYEKALWGPELGKSLNTTNISVNASVGLVK